MRCSYVGWVAAILLQCSMAVRSQAADTLAKAEFASVEEARKSGRAVKPVRVEREGDFEVERYELATGSLFELRTRGWYVVQKVRKDGVELVPVPGQRGLLPGIWAVSKGETRIGNRHSLIVSAADEAKQTVTLSPRIKVRFRFLDALNF